VLSQTYTQWIKEMDTGTTSNSACACVQYCLFSPNRALVNSQLWFKSRDFLTKKINHDLNQPDLNRPTLRIVVIIEFHLLKSVNEYWTLSNWHVFLCCSSFDDVVVVEAEWSATGVAGDSADESVLSTVCEWLWQWWRPPSMHIRQIQKFWASIFHSAVFSLLILESDTDRLATVTHSSMGQTPAQEAHWTWVVCLQH